MSSYNIKQFEYDLHEFGINLSSKQFTQFIRYYEILVEYNGIMNLTTITNFDEVLKKHFIDSLSLIKAYEIKKNDKFIDVGTGAGFPGIPLKIAFPEIDMTLLDSLKKRVFFLQNVCSELELTGVDWIHGRAEDYAKPDKLREKFDVCCSRAVANLSTLTEYCLPFVKVGGVFISYKSEKINEEIITAQRAISVLGGKVENQVELLLPESDIYRNLVVIKKVKKTLSIYPRKAGIASKEPIV